MAAQFITGTSDLIPASGSLKEIGLKPWWETIQSYCLYALFAIDVMIFYVNASFSSVTCSPSVSEASSLSTPEANFVNSICYGQIDDVFRYSGRNVLIGCVALYLLHAWWELVPVVTTRFVAAKNVDNLLHQRHLPKSEIGRIVKTPLKNEEKLDEGKNNSKVVRDACRRLFFCDDVHFSLFGIYVLRNILSISGAAVASWLAWVSYDQSTKQGGPTFKCTLDNETATGLKVTVFRCSNHLPIQLAGYFLAVFIILLVMEVMSCIALSLSLMKRRLTTIAENSSEEGKDLMKDYAFVILFSDHSTKVHRSTAVVLSLISEDVLGDMEKNIENGIKLEDKDFLRLFYSLRKDGKTKIIETAEAYMRGADETGKNTVRNFLKYFRDLFMRKNGEFDTSNYHSLTSAVENTQQANDRVGPGQAVGTQPPQHQNTGNQSSGSLKNPRNINRSDQEEPAGLGNDSGGRVISCEQATVSRVDETVPAESATQAIRPNRSLPCDSGDQQQDAEGQKESNTTTEAQKQGADPPYIQTQYNIGHMSGNIMN